MANIYNMADTWNAGGTTFTAIKMNVTDTSSAAASLLMDLQVGGTSKCNVDKTGILTLNGVSSVGAKIVSTAEFRTAGILLGFNLAAGAGIAFSSANFSQNYGGCAADGFVSINRYLFASTLSSTPDVALSRVAAGVIGVCAGTSGGAALEFIEQTAPPAPATNGVRIYAVDNGASKTRLMALFATGAAQQLAIEP